jgi:hypothetical protein
LLATDPAGDIFLGRTRGGYSLRSVVYKRSTEGSLTRVAGAFGASFSPPEIGDGGPATRVSLGELDGAAETADGGLLLAANSDPDFSDEYARIRLVSGAGTAYLASALVADGSRSGVGAYGARYVITQPASVDVTVSGHADRLQAHALGHQGANRLIIRHHFRPGVYALTLRATSAAGGIATQRAWRALGARLPRGLAFEALGFAPGAKVGRARRSWATAADFAGEDSRLSACRRFSTLRVDCEVQETDETGYPPFSCAKVAAIVLHSNGLLDERDYRCPRRHHSPFIRRPRPWSRAAVDLRALWTHPPRG